MNRLKVELRENRKFVNNKYYLSQISFYLQISGLI